MGPIIGGGGPGYGGVAPAHGGSYGGWPESNLGTMKVTNVIISINNIVSSQVTISMEEKARDPLLVVLVVDLVAMVEEWGRQHTEDTGAGVGPTTG